MGVGRRPPARTRYWIAVCKAGDRASCSPVGAGTHAKFGAERPIEVGDVAKAGIERDIDDLSGLRNESRRRVAQPRTEHVLVRRYTGQPLECAEEVVGTETAFLRQVAECELRVWVAIDLPHRPRNTRFRVPGQRVLRRGLLGRESCGLDR